MRFFGSNGFMIGSIRKYALQSGYIVCSIDLIIPQQLYSHLNIVLDNRRNLSASFCSISSDIKKGKGSPHSTTKRRVPELIPVLGSQPAGDVNHKPGGRLPLLSARPAVTPAALKRTATNFAAL